MPVANVNSHQRIYVEPVSPIGSLGRTGDVWFDTLTSHIYVRNRAGWQDYGLFPAYPTALPLLSSMPSAGEVQDTDLLLIERGGHRMSITGDKLGGAATGLDGSNVTVVNGKFCMWDPVLNGWFEVMLSNGQFSVGNQIIS